VLVVLFRVVLCRFFSMLRGKEMVAMRKLGMMARFFVGTSLMVFRCFPMMPGSVLVMFGRLLVMLRTLMFGHFVAPSFLKLNIGNCNLLAPAECFQKRYVTVN